MKKGKRVMAMTTSVRKNFTLTNVVALSKYLKGFTPKIEKDKQLLEFLDAMYTHGPDENFDVLYHGFMFRGISSNLLLQIENIDSMEYASWSKDIDVAVDFANKQHAWHQYLLIHYGWAIDPAKVKTIALNRFDTITGLENYYPSREKEVIAPLLPSECLILDISGNNRKPVENFEQIIGK